MTAMTITRKFSLLPDTSDLSLKNQSYKEMTDLFVKLQALKNEYVELMVEDVKANSFDSYTFTSMSKFRQAVYDRLEFSLVSSPQVRSFELKERARQCAFYDAYLTVREWIKRTENLRILIDKLIEKFQTDEAFTISFLKGKRFRFSELKELKEALKKDCFDARQSLSTHFLNNHVLQLRNLFLARNDFESERLFSEKILKNPLQEHVRDTFTSLELDDLFVESVVDGFTRVKKRKEVPVLQSELPEYMVMGFFRKVQWATTRQLRQVLSLRKKITKENSKTKSSKKKVERHRKSLETVCARLSDVLGEDTPFSKFEFANQRKQLLDGLKQDFLEKVGAVDLKGLAIEACQEELASFQQEPNHHILKRVFKPSFARIRVNALTFESFLEYFKQQLRYKARELLKGRFISNEFASLMVAQFRALQSDLDTLVKPPDHSALSLSVMNRDVYQEDFATLHADKGRKFYKLKLGLVSRQFKSFLVRDDKERIRALANKGFTPALPSISFKGRKLLLNLPLVKHDKNEERLKPVLSKGTSDVELGIDLGLKHFAVVSVFDRRQDKEVARYFLGVRELFDKQFDGTNGKLRFQTSKKGGRASNVKLTLIRLREQIQALQRKKCAYEQRVLSRGVSIYRTKLKWNKTRRQLSACWERLRRINLQVVHHVNHHVVQIARFWNASLIKMEDLRWATHSKKRDAGTFLAFWQAHWFYSQVQSAIKLQCSLHGIRFARVPAEYTSQTCSRCGKHGSRAGKAFTCAECGLRLDSDLNASRNIAKYQR